MKNKIINSKSYGLTTIYFYSDNSFKVYHAGNSGNTLDTVIKNVNIILTDLNLSLCKYNPGKEKGSPDHYYEAFYIPKY